MSAVEPAAEIRNTRGARLDHTFVAGRPGRKADHRFTGAHPALLQAVVPWMGRQLAPR